MTVRLSIGKLAKLLAGRSEDEIADVLGDIIETDDVQSDAPPVALKPALKSKRANSKSTNGARIIEVQAWRTLGTAAEELTIPVHVLQEWVEDCHIDEYRFGKYRMVNVRQIEHWREYKQKLTTIDAEVFERWLSVSASEDALGVSQNTVRNLVTAGRVAHYKTGNEHTAPVLVNLDEVERVLLS